MTSSNPNARSSKLWLAAAAAIAIAAPLHAAPGDWVKGVQPVAAMAEPDAVPLPVANARPANVHEGWAQQAAGQRIVYNIAKPTLVPFASSLPAGRNAPAVILVPGGGFQFLAIDNEGYDVARRLDALGVRVFIVKYRTLPLQPDSFAGFIEAITKTFVQGGNRNEILADLPLAVADTQAAIRLVRARAGEWHVDPSRVGILGFSAGAYTVLGTTEANAADARPDFAGMIYGPTEHAAVPDKAPPLFAAIAADDRFFNTQSFGLMEDWRKAGGSIEFHLYSAGGHGFASRRTGTTTDAWFDQFSLWLQTQGITSAR